jgi:cobaltochelatase CobN
VRAVAALDESDEMNPIAMRVREDQARLLAEGASIAESRRRAAARVYGPMPGAYGAGLQALIDEGGWRTRDDFARAFVAWGGWSYAGAERDGEADHNNFARRLSRVEAVVQNQDNRAHDVLDSDDYYQFEGGLAASVEHLRGTSPAIYHVDTSLPERPRANTLAEEIARVVRGRATNPRWIAGCKRHGYKGAFEMAATVDYLFAFAATTDAVRDHHFDAVYEAYLGDGDTRAFIAEVNQAALQEIAERFLEAERRGLWHPRSNSALGELRTLATRGRSAS